VEVNIARRAAVVPRAPCAAAARGAAAVGDDQREVVWVVRRGGERLRVAGAGLVDAHASHFRSRIKKMQAFELVSNLLARISDFIGLLASSGQNMQANSPKTAHF